MTDGKILFLGCGHMGGALLKGWVNFGGLEKTQFVIVEPSQEIRKNLKKDGYKTFAALQKLPKKTAIKLAVLAVRPDVLKTVLPVLKGKLSAESLVLSIAAGKEISFIQKFLPDNVVIRLMPNMAVAEGLGVSGLFSSPKATQEQKDFIYKLMASCSSVLWLDKEADMHKIVALGGSSPAYIYSCALALQQAAKEYKLPDDFIAQAAVNVFLGSAVLFAKSQGSLQDSINKICTKGGTTEAAVKCFNDKNALVKLFAKAMKACAARSKELAK